MKFKVLYDEAGSSRLLNLYCMVNLVKQFDDYHGLNPSSNLSSISIQNHIVILKKRIDERNFDGLSHRRGSNNHSSLELD